MDVWTRESLTRHRDETLPKISLLAHTVIMVAVLEEVTLTSLVLDLSVHRRVNFSRAVSRTVKCVARVFSNAMAMLVQLDGKDPDLVTHLSHLILHM